MGNIISAILSLVVITAFLGGLAYSIWENTEDIAFPVIVAIILAMAYRSAYDEFKERNDV
ncbi:MAG: hypothetical protein V7749_17645 [Cocleimonas sp.]